MKQTYSALLKDFQHSILKNNLQAAPAMFRDKSGFPPAEQLNVYAAGYRLRLAEVVREDFLALRYYMGEKKFDALVLQYIEATPSQHFNIEKYPWGFAAFVRTTIKDEFACELAALESAISKVYRIEESAAANPALLSHITPDALAAQRFPLRVAHQLFAFSYPVNRYLTAFREDKKPTPPTKEQSYTTVWRHNNIVQRLDLEKEEFLLLSLLARGATLGEALEHPEFTAGADMEKVATQLQKWFERWLTQGMLAA